MGDMSKEPSMEEILSSIKRIIAEEGDEGASIPRGPRRGRLEVVPTDVEEPMAEAEDVLELTPLSEEAPAVEDSAAEDLVAEDSFDAPAGLVEESEEPLELTPPTFDEPEAELIEAAVPDVLEHDAPEDQLEPEVTEAETATVAEEVLELTEEIDTEEKVTPSNAAPALSGAESMISVESEIAARHSLSALSSMIVAPEGSEGNTVEDLVKAMLRPLLKEWLDAKLPSLVEGMVAKEISRITGGVR